MERSFPGGMSSKEPAYHFRNVKDSVSSFLSQEDHLEKGQVNPPVFSCLRNPWQRAWQLQSMGL